MSQTPIFQATATDSGRLLDRHEAVNPSRLPISVCLGYGAGTVGISILLNAVSAYYPAFMTTVLGQSPQLAGLLMMLSKLYDAVIDLLIGSLSDRTRSRWGRRRPYLLAGGAVSAASFLMIFSPPSLSDSSVVIYMMAALVLYSTGYSLFNVPYVAMASEMTSDFHERTRLWSFRTVFVSIGQLLSMAGTAALIKFGGGGTHGYQIMGVVLAAVIFTAMITSFFGTARAQRIERSSTPKPPVLTQLKLVWANQHFMWLMGAKIFQFLAFASLAGTNVLFMLNVLKVGYSGLIELATAQNITTAISMPVWVWIAKKLGKRQAYLCGVGIFLLTSLSWLLTGPGIGDVALLSRGVVGGFGSAGMILMSMSMLSDTMAYDRYSTGIHREGVYSSIVAILEKTGYAVGIAINGAFLAWAGYVSTTGGKLVEQPSSAVTAMYAGIAVIPAVFFVGNMLCMFRYGLDNETLKAAAQRSASVGK